MIKSIYMIMMILAAAPMTVTVLAQLSPAVEAGAGSTEPTKEQGELDLSMLPPSQSPDQPSPIDFNALFRQKIKLTNITMEMPEVVYQSASTVVIEADLLSNAIINKDIGIVDDVNLWQAVDLVKSANVTSTGNGNNTTAAGAVHYHISSINLEGQGSQGNPHKVLIVLER